MGLGGLQGFLSAIFFVLAALSSADLFGPVAVGTEGRKKREEWAASRAELGSGQTSQAKPWLHLAQPVDRGPTSITTVREG